MPGFCTHYIFGTNTYPDIESRYIRETISFAPGVYGLGLQGPDLFFYFLPSYAMHGQNLGSTAHEKRIHEFYRNLLNSRNLFSLPRERHAAEAYILGFLGHYCLDTACHPYVYSRTNFRTKSQRYSSKHMTLETDIDQIMLQKYKHILPSQFHQDRTIRMNHREMRVVATMLHYTFSNTYPEYFSSYSMMRSAIGSIRLGLKLLRDSSGRKKLIVRNLEKHITGYAAISPMIPHDRILYYYDPCNERKKEWTSPFAPNETRNQSMYELVRDAHREYLQLIQDAAALFSEHTDGYDSAKLNRLLFHIGNKSYHSGLPIT